MADKESAFANNLRVLRIVRGYSQEELARMVGVSTASVVNWESGDNTPSLSNIVKLADIFGCTLEELVSTEPYVLTASKGA